MKKTLSLVLLLFVLVSPVFSSDASRKIVVFRSGILRDSEQDKLIEFLGGDSIKGLNIINAKVAYLLPTTEEALRINPAVLRVDDDSLVQLADASGGLGGILDSIVGRIFGPLQLPLLRIRGIKPQPAQTIPWGVKYVGADLAWPVTTGATVTVGILDTGIDLRHPDLKNNIAGGYNALAPLRQPQDDNGHGTHVAGIIGALNNAIGVVGVAPDAFLYPVKVLGADGTGYVSDVIDGLQWADANNIQVVNMSFGATADVQSLHDAIAKAYADGVFLVAAAGNTGDGVLYPAKYPEVVAVSAIDESGAIETSSSRGKEIAFAAPGMDIYSTYLNQDYAMLSGTSEAAAFVSGLAALELTQPVGAYDTDLNGVWDPAELRAKLASSTVNLGGLGKNNLYGFGLIYAPKLLAR